MPTLPDGWIVFEALGPSIKSKELTGSLFQSVTMTKLCHLGWLVPDGSVVVVPHHSKSPKSYHIEIVTTIGPESWREMGCVDCQRAYAQLPA